MRKRGKGQNSSLAKLRLDRLGQKTGELKEKEGNFLKVVEPQTAANRIFLRNPAEKGRDGGGRGG